MYCEYAYRSTHSSEEMLTRSRRHKWADTTQMILHLSNTKYSIPHEYHLKSLKMQNTRVHFSVNGYYSVQIKRENGKRTNLKHSHSNVHTVRCLLLNCILWRKRLWRVGNVHTFASWHGWHPLKQSQHPKFIILFMICNFSGMGNKVHFGECWIFCFICR